jgi:hypothetical protein
MDAFMNDVKQLFDAQDRLRQFGASVNQTRKPLRERERELSQTVAAYMRENRIDVCDYRGEKLVLKVMERAAPITLDAVREAVRAASGDGALSERCVSALAARPLRQTVALRRVKGKRPRPAPRSSRAQAGAGAPSTAAVPVALPAAVPASAAIPVGGANMGVIDSAPPLLSELSDDD